MNNKPKKCVECGKEFNPFRTTQKVCSTKCAVKHSSWPQRKKRMQESLKTRTQKINDVLNQYFEGYD